MQITEAAVFYSRLSKWDDHFDGLPPHRIDQMIYFKLSFEQVAGGFGGSQFVVDISETLQAKLASIACYESQFAHRQEYLFQRIRGIAAQAGGAAGFAAGEAFVNSRALGVKDPMPLLFGAP